MVLTVMADFVTLIRIQAMMKLSSHSTLPGVKFEPVWGTAIRGLENGSPFLVTIKKLPYSENALLLAIHAAVRLRNWIMTKEQLS